MESVTYQALIRKLQELPQLSISGIAQVLAGANENEIKFRLKDGQIVRGVIKETDSSYEVELADGSYAMIPKSMIFGKPS